jgi:hypothetical protein
MHTHYVGRDENKLTGLVRDYLGARRDPAHQTKWEGASHARARAAEMMVQTAVQRAGRRPVLVVPPPPARVIFGAVVREENVEKKLAGWFFEDLVGDGKKAKFQTITTVVELEDDPDYDDDTTGETDADLGGTMTTEKILAAAAEILGLEDVGELKLAARERLAAKQATQHAKPPRLLWNKDNAPDENPAMFAWRAYAAEAEAKTLHLGVIRQEDEPLAVKLVSWLRSPANRKQVPEGFDIPTKPDWLKRQDQDHPVQPPPPPPRTEEVRRYTRESVRRSRARHRPTATVNL